ncbi:MAG: hypothetical protein PHU71_07595, partial [Candidatus Gracilibacteria bacterium]|nr:hypothetical protein [Candidatus Gracilibacteria bacterium]
LDTNVGNSLDLRGNTLNLLLKDLYESLEQLVNDEATARASADDALDTRLDAAETAIIDHESRIDTAETAIIDHESRIDTAETAIIDHESRIDAAETIIAALQNDAVVAGIAVPSTDPGTPVLKTAYFANTNGTYTNFKDDENAPYVITDQLVMFIVRPGNFTQRYVLANL